MMRSPMHRFYLPPENCHDPILTLSDREAHHALHVLRLRRGDRATVLDGVGHEYTCEVAETGRARLRLAVQGKQAIPPLPYRVTLFQALPKGKLIESIVQKATELGVHRVVPLVTERVVAQLDQDIAEKKVEHWRQVAIEAIKQCGSPWLPKIESPIAIGDFVARMEKLDLNLIASLQDERRHPREWFEAFEAKNARLPQSVGVWVGPEGDFSPVEVNLVLSSGALPITLGPLVLRSETAAIYCLSTINYEMQFRSKRSQPSS
jgi:16S rRNA (uracil1498-N3)-methyltransferase